MSRLSLHAPQLWHDSLGTVPGSAAPPLASEAPASSPYAVPARASLFVAIETCLDNRQGCCFVLDEGRRPIARISLDDIGAAVMDGVCGTAGQLACTVAERRATAGEPLASDYRLTPILDGLGRYSGAVVDSSGDFVQIARPDLSHVEFRALTAAFLSSWISGKGPAINQFERDFAAYCRMRRGVATSNGTTALHLALMALNIGPGDEVIVPDLTFAATINAVLMCGATPVITDVDPRSWTMSAHHLADAITPHTKAVIPVHLYGRPAEIGPIAEFARRHKIAVIEDCAEAHGATYDGAPIGSFSTISCFSFHANKIISTGEGGMCLTNSEELGERVMRLRDHGMSTDRPYWHEEVGYNYRMTNLQAALGTAQLSRVDALQERGRELERQYRRALGGIPGVAFPPEMEANSVPVVWLACVQVPAKVRSRLIASARQSGVELRPFFYSLSSMPAYRRIGHPCPVSEQLSVTGLNLPTSNAVDENVVARIAAIFHDTLA